MCYLLEMIANSSINDIYLFLQMLLENVEGIHLIRFPNVFVSSIVHSKYYIAIEYYR